MFAGMFQSRRLDITKNHTSFITDVDVLDSKLSCFLFQVVVIYSVCRIFSIFGLYYKQPTVIFEIIGGIVLGPSCLGRIDIFSTTIFPTASLTYIKQIAQFGLQVYLFLVGLELDLNLMLQQIKTTGVIALVSMSVPFGAGMAIAIPLYEHVKVDQTTTGANPTKHSLIDLAVFIGTAMSITALPVLARILKENFLMLTLPGSIAFGAAVITGSIDLDVGVV
jgi:Kef-type K+ transport system membrane component KefB